MSPLLIYAIIIVAAIGAMVGWSNSKKGATWGQPVTIVCAIIAIGFGFYQAVAGSFGKGGSKKSQAREIEYQKVQTRKLGAYLKEKFAGKTAILVKDPNANETSPQIIGLKEGIGDAITISEEVSPTPPKSARNVGPDGGPGGPEGMMEPMETWFTAKELDKILKGKKADLIITTIGLPSGLSVRGGKEFPIPSLKGKKVVLAGGSIYEHGRDIQAGAIVAAVSYKPNAEYDEKPAPSDLDEAFNKRYVLVTNENLNEVIKQYPDLFAKQR